MNFESFDYFDDVYDEFSLPLEVNPPPLITPLPTQQPSMKENCTEINESSLSSLLNIPSSIMVIIYKKFIS